MSIDIASTREVRPDEWIDSKRKLWMLGLVIPLLPFVAWGLVSLTGVGLFWWTGPLIVFGLIPLLDRLCGLDTSNPPPEAEERLEADHYYRWCTYLYLPLQLAGFVTGAWLTTRGGLSWVDRLGLAVTVGFVSGIGIANAHELGHKKERSERWLARLVLAQSAYGHFYVEHNRGHHARVATPDDPASSRLGETFWEFLPRTVVGSLRSAWDLESKRLRNQHLPVFSLHNDVLTAWAMTVVLFAGIVAVFGPGALPYVVVQAVLGFCLLEIVNYIEHYGLLRQRVANGRYERCRPEHSWNANHVASNVLLYHLERHSDHHAHPTRRYQLLRHFDDSPQLPTGYAGMIALAAVPPLWRRTMDPLVLAHYAGDVTRASIQPRLRHRYLARYAGTIAG